VDIHGLRVLASLIDIYWREPSIALAAELRLQAPRFGLDPAARKSLGWHVTDQEPESAPTTADGSAATDDPRMGLRVVP
jgi:hypothetical protein